MEPIYAEYWNDGVVIDSEYIHHIPRIGEAVQLKRGLVRIKDISWGTSVNGHQIAQLDCELE